MDRQRSLPQVLRNDILLSCVRPRRDSETFDGTGRGAMGVQPHETRSDMTALIQK
jgi:hypothetical protein